MNDSTLPVPRHRAWAVLIVVFVLMIVDYVDRQVVVSMFPHLKAEWRLSDSQLGGLASIVAVMVALGTVPLSIVADRWGRVKSMFLMALFWSMATIACGFAGTYLQLLGARGAVGLGEAAYGTAGAALVATLFPSRLRSTMLGVFLAAAVFGSVLGVVLGGIIAERWGWRMAFGAVGLPGIILAFLFLLVAGGSDTMPRQSAQDGTESIGLALRRLLRRTALMACLGSALQLVVVSTTYAWLPSYLHRFYGLPPDQAGARTGLVILISGLGIVLWSVGADRLARRFARARLHVPVAAALTTAGLMWIAFDGFAPGSVQFWLIAAGALAMTGTVGPVAAVVIDVARPEHRATAASILALMQNLFGLAGGPLLTGLLADVYGLQFAMSVVPILSLVAAALLVIAARTYAEDLKTAQREEAKPGDSLESR